MTDKQNILDSMDHYIVECLSFTFMYKRPILLYGIFLVFNILM